MDKYTWLAIYNDSSQLSQINPDGSKNAYKDIDRTRLASFNILDKQLNVVLSVPFIPGDNLIWRRRVEMNAEVGATEIVQLVGKQSTINGENRQVVFAVFESDGHIEVSDKWDDKHPWFFPVQINTHEGESE